MENIEFTISKESNFDFTTTVFINHKDQNSNLSQTFKKNNKFFIRI